MAIVLISLLGLLVIANVVVSVGVVRSPFYDRSQKLFQLLIVWFVPILGAALAWSFVRTVASERATTDLTDRFGFDDGNVNPNSDASDLGGFGGSGH